MGHQATLLRQRVLRGRGDLGQGHALIPPGDDVPRIGNVDSCLVATAFHNARLVHIEEFWMQCAAV